MLFLLYLQQQTEVRQISQYHNETVFCAIQTPNTTVYNILQSIIYSYQHYGNCVYRAPVLYYWTKCWFINMITST